MRASFSLAWAVGAIIAMATLGRGTALRLRRRRLRPHWHTMRRIVRVGLPNLFESVVALWQANFMVLMVVGLLPAGGTLGAHMVVIRVEAISFMPVFAMGIAAATLTGQYLGIGDVRSARRAVVLCWLAAISFITLLGLVFMLVPNALVRIFTDAAPLLAAAPTPVASWAWSRPFRGRTSSWARPCAAPGTRAAPCG